MRTVKQNILYLQYDNIMIKRPSVIPFNIINIGKIYAAGYVNGITMVIFSNEDGKPANQINYFIMVPKVYVNGLITGNKYIVDKFVEQAINGLYQVYIEDNPNYFI